MADTYTDFLRLVRPEIGGSRDAWGSKGNENWSALDSWAKSTDALAKAALSASATALQNVAGPVNFAKGLSSPAGVSVAFGDVFSRREDGKGFIGLGVPERGLGWDGQVYSLPGGDLMVGGFKVWHAGNLTPGASTGGGATGGTGGSGGAGSGEASTADVLRYTADLEVYRNNPGLRLKDSGGKSDWYIRGVGDGALQFTNSGAQDNIFNFKKDGSFSTKLLGDVGQRIETRAQAYANSALDSAKNAVNTLGQQRLHAVALQGTGEMNLVGNGANTVYYDLGGNGGVVTGLRVIGITSGGGAQITHARVRYLYMFRPDLGGWVGAYIQ